MRAPGCDRRTLGAWLCAPVWTASPSCVAVPPIAAVTCSCASLAACLARHSCLPLRLCRLCRCYALRDRWLRHCLHASTAASGRTSSAAVAFCGVRSDADAIAGLLHRGMWAGTWV
eukprot:scaffold19731_cov133-Isochrysis_galbana.AAC.3